MQRKIAVEIISFLFIALFVYAALMKLIDYEKFKVQLDQSPLLMAFSGWIAWAVPAVELVIAAMLMLKRTLLISMYAAYTLMVMFTVYIVFILTLAPQVPCSCGGILESMGWTEHLIFNIAFVLLAAAATVMLTWQPKPIQDDQPKIQYA